MPSERRVAWVTGGGRGIGRASALALAQAGHDVAVSARSGDELQRVADECRKLGARAEAVLLDVTDAARVDAAYKEVVQRLGAPGVLVNSAGVAKSAPFHKTTPELMESLWRVNVMGCYHTTRAAMPAMLQAGWGRVVHVASIAGKVGSPYITAYATSKHALVGFTRSLAVEVATKGVTVNAVCPGYVDTPMTDGNVENIVRLTGMPREQVLDHMRNASPQKRLIEADEVARVVAHLAAPEARGINGQAINIDGGGVQW